jgi:hypothetical protein
MGADRALVVLHRDHRVARVAACDGLDAMGAAKWVGQIIRREQPARVTDATPASIHAGPRRQALRRPVVSQVARRFGTARRVSNRASDSRCDGAGHSAAKESPSRTSGYGQGSRAHAQVGWSDADQCDRLRVSKSLRPPAGPLAGRLPWAPIPAGERKGYRAVVFISFMTGPIRNQARRVVPLDQRRATTGMTGEESPAAHRATAGAAQRDVPRMRAAPHLCQQRVRKW